jgi:3'(2'),5'-bisphosphate nucleotidase
MPDNLLDQMIAAALAAGEVILEVYRTPFDAEHKQDGSPVTLADQRAEEIILAALASTGIPMLAEESAAAGRIPHLGARFFAIDPLDGTKEFIKRNGEFTVNIALVEDGRPTMGVVTAPALGVGYAGGPDGAVRFNIHDGVAGPKTTIAVNRSGPMNIVASRSHGHAALEKLGVALKVSGNVSVGSSLKFCLVAEGKARLYPRFTPTCEWDTAAGQAVLEAAGGTVLTLDGSSLHYGKSGKDFLNPYFVASDDHAAAAQAAKLMAELIQ